MSQIETAEMIAGKHLVSAAAVLENRADLRSYPHRYLAVHGYAMMRGEGLRLVMSAVEMLDKYGYELVCISELKDQVYAFMRRVAA